MKTLRHLARLVLLSTVVSLLSSDLSAQPTPTLSSPSVTVDKTTHALVWPTDFFTFNIGNRLIPSGGATGYVLTKNSSTSYDYSWAAPAASGALQASNNLSDLANAATARINLGVAIGSAVEAWSTNLDTWSGKTPPSGTAVGTTDAQNLTNKTLDGTLRLTVTTNTGTSYTVLAADYVVTLNNASAVAVTLPALSGLSGKPLLIKSLGTGIVTITANGAETIFANSAVNSFQLATGDSVELVATSAYWLVN